MSYDMLGQLVSRIMTVPENMLGALCDLAEKLASEKGGEWGEELLHFLRREPCWVGERVKKVKHYLHRIFKETKLVVKATILHPMSVESETFVGCGLFNAGVSGRKVPREYDRPTSETEATVWELSNDGTLSQVFGSLGEGRRRWTECQVVAFVRDHISRFHRGDGLIFFELEGDLVANVDFCGEGGLWVGVGPLSESTVWHATKKHRFVLLK